MYYLPPRDVSEKIQWKTDKGILRTLGKSDDWSDVTNGPGTVTVRDVYNLLRRRIHELRIEQLAIAPNTRKIEELSIRIQKIQEGIQRRKAKCLINEQRRNITLDIHEPYDSLREYLLNVWRLRLFVSKNQEEVEDFMLMLKHVLALVQNKYRQLDRKFWLRDDGSSRFSHAWQALEILLCRYHFYDAEMIIAILLHDFLEDFVGTDEEKETILRISIGNINPNADMVEHVMPMIQAMTKRPLTDYYRPHERLISVVVSDSQKKALENQLKDRRTKDYFGWLLKATHKVLIMKCADRQHALEHMVWVDVEKVRRKITETEIYFLPALELRVKKTQGKYKKLFDHIYHDMTMTIENLKVQYGVIPNPWNISTGSGA